MSARDRGDVEQPCQPCYPAELGPAVFATGPMRIGLSDARDRLQNAPAGRTRTLSKVLIFRGGGTAYSVTTKGPTWRCAASRWNFDTASVAP